MANVFEEAPMIGAFLSMVLFFSIACGLPIPLWAGFVPIGLVFVAGIACCAIGATFDFIKKKIKS